MTPASPFPPLPGPAGRPFLWTNATQASFAKGLSKEGLRSPCSNRSTNLRKLWQGWYRVFSSTSHDGVAPHRTRSHRDSDPRRYRVRAGLGREAGLGAAARGRRQPAVRGRSALHDRPSGPAHARPRRAERRGLQSRAGTGRAGIRRRLSRSSAPAGGGADQQPERTRRRRSRQAEDRRARAAHLQRLSHLAADRSAARPDAAHRPAQRAGPERSDLRLARAVSAIAAGRRLLQHDQPAHARAPRLAQRRQRQRAARDAAARGPVSRHDRAAQESSRRHLLVPRPHARVDGGRGDERRRRRADRPRRPRLGASGSQPRHRRRRHDPARCRPGALHGYR